MVERIKSVSYLSKAKMRGGGFNPNLTQTSRERLWIASAPTFDLTTARSLFQHH